MTMLEAPHWSPLDSSTHEFISTFMSHVATIAGYGRDRTAIIARVKTLLLTALEAGDDDSMAPWGMLHQTVAAIVETVQDAHDTRSAHAYLRSFVQENADLAVCTWPKSVPAA